MQLKMMRQGMDLYIDLKGKKKEGKGIGFPVKRDPNANDPMMSIGNTNNEDPAQQTPEQRKARMKAIRATMALNLVAMKVFGFSSNEPEEQGLLMPGSANIAFAWDSTDVMCIEYKIPISLISPSAMNQKDISVGWKINGFQRPTHPASTESEASHNRGGGRGGYGGGYGGQSRSSEEFENFMRDQSFWTKYTFK